MTIPSKRTRAVLLTEKFLYDLTNPKVTPRLPRSIRQQANMLLRHYPSRIDLEITNEGWDNPLVECPFGDYKIL